MIADTSSGLQHIAYYSILAVVIVIAIINITNAIYLRTAPDESDNDKIRREMKIGAIMMITLFAIWCILHINIYGPITRL